MKCCHIHHSPNNFKITTYTLIRTYILQHNVSNFWSRIHIKSISVYLVLRAILVMNISIIIVFCYNIEYTNDEWSVNHVWNSDQLLKKKNEIGGSLIHRIVDSRLQDGAATTDLIGLIKSPSSRIQQQVGSNS